MIKKTRILSLSIISSLFLFTLLVSGVEAKTLYVDPNGNDSTTYTNNSASNPWRTIGRASWGSTNREARNGAEAAKAGDVVQVNSGTYSGVGTGSRNEIYYYQENSGTVGNPITFKANGTVTLTQTGTGAMIGSYGRNYITWDGFTIDEANARSAGDTGPTTVYDCTGCVLQNLNLTGNGTDFGRLDNHTGIRIEGSRSITVRNTKITNVYTAHNPNNGACIQTYASYGLTIENNELSNCGSGIFLKGGPWPAGSGPTISSYIRNNYIHDIGESARGGSAIIAHAGAPYTAQNPVYIYKNVIKNVTEAGFRLWLFSDTEVGNNPQYVKFANNTIDHAGYGIHVSSPLTISLGHTFWNNIVTNSGSAIAYNDVQSNIVESRVDFEHNLYFNNAIFAEIGNGTRYTLSTWKSTYGHDSSSPTSVSTDPMFVSSTDYHLLSNSPARNLGVDIYDLNSNGSNSDIVPAGAYVTGSEVIGLTSDTTPPPPPVVITPTVDLKVNGSDASVTVASGASVTLSWISTNSTTCSLSPSGFTGTSGAQSVMPTLNTTYLVSCTGSFGTATDSVVVNVSAPIINTPTATSTSEWVFCANENNVCNFSGTKEVRFGANNMYNTLTFTNSVNCTYDVFGDPILNVVKQCQYKNIVTSTPTPTTPVPTPTVPTNTPATTTPPSTTISLGDRVQTTAKVNVRYTANGRKLGTQSRGAQGVVTEGPTSASGYSWYKVNFTSGVDGWVVSTYLSKVSTTTLSADELRNSIANILLLIQQLQEQMSKMKGN